MMRRLLPLLLLVLAACGDALQGSWVPEDAADSQRLEFKDNLVTVTTRIDGKDKVRQYLYKVIEETSDTLVMDWVDNDQEPVRVVAKFEGEQLLVDFAGQKFVFQRP